MNVSWTTNFQLNISPTRTVLSLSSSHILLSVHQNHFDYWFFPSPVVLHFLSLSPSSIGSIISVIEWFSYPPHSYYRYKSIMAIVERHEWIIYYSANGSILLHNCIEMMHEIESFTDVIPEKDNISFCWSVLTCHYSPITRRLSLERVGSWMKRNYRAWSIPSNAPRDIHVIRLQVNRIENKASGAKGQKSQVNYTLLTHKLLWQCDTLFTGLQ